MEGLGDLQPELHSRSDAIRFRHQFCVFVGRLIRESKLSLASTNAQHSQDANNETRRFVPLLFNFFYLAKISFSSF
jgi:hypothetical protein